jgi:hypothetical protein
MQHIQPDRVQYKVLFLKLSNLWEALLPQSPFRITGSAFKSPPPPQTETTLVAYSDYKPICGCNHNFLIQCVVGRYGAEIRTACAFGDDFLLGLGAVWSRRQISKFRRNLMSPSSGLKINEDAYVSEKHTVSFFSPAEGKGMFLRNLAIYLRAHTES